MQSLVKGESIEYSIKFIEIRGLKGEYRIYLHIYLLWMDFIRIMLLFSFFLRNKFRTKSKNSLNFILSRKIHFFKDRLKSRFDIKFGIYVKFGGG